MGLLDDAIREHLDLKRRGGADPAEIERAEREALGPVRRDRTSLAFNDEHDDPGLPPPPRNEVVEAPRPAKRRGLLRRSRGNADRLDAVDLDFEEHEPLVRVEPMHRPEEFDDERSDAAGEPFHDDHPRDHELDRDDPPRDHELDRDDPPRDHELDQDDPRDPPRLRIEAPADTVGPPIASAEPSSAAVTGRDRPPADGSFDETAEYNVESTFTAEPAGDDVLEETPEFLQDTPDHDRLWFEQRPPRDFDFDG
jgi:hypothetical protein